MNLRGDRRGVVMMEFLIALFPVMLAFLGFTQFCFAAVAKLAVRHAAVLATRAAVVVLEEAGTESLPGPPADIYSGLKAGLLEVQRPKGTKETDPSKDQKQAQVDDIKNASGSAGSATDLLGGLTRTDSRIKQIRTAAYIPLIAISPSVIDEGIQLVSNIGNGELAPEGTVRDAIGNADMTRVAGALLYNMGAVAVTFPKQPNKPESEELSDGYFDRGATITARVTYLFRCQVPFASLITCSSGWSLLLGDAWVDPFTMQRIVHQVGNPPKDAGELVAWTDHWKSIKWIRDRSQARVDAFKGRKQEFDEVESPFMRDALLALPSARYMLLTAEAHLPLQSARYYDRGDTGDRDKMWNDKDKQQQNQGGGGGGPDLRVTLEPVAKAISGAATEIDQTVQGAQGTVQEVRHDIDQGKRTASKVKSLPKDTRAAANQSINKLKGQSSSAAGQLNNVGKSQADQLGNQLGGQLKNAGKDALKDVGQDGIGGLDAKDFLP